MSDTAPAAPLVGRSASFIKETRSLADRAFDAPNALTPLAAACAAMGPCPSPSITITLVVFDSCTCDQLSPHSVSPRTARLTAPTTLFRPAGCDLTAFASAAAPPGQTWATMTV